MSERMTDEAVTQAVATVLDDVSHHGAVDAVQALGVECSRSRASEEQKDAVIKALADALEQHGARVTCAVCGGVGAHRPLSMIWYCEQGPTAYHPDVAYALRLAGRL